MTENEENNDCIEERISVPIIVPASSLSFEPLCKLNEDKSQKDLQPSDFALLCVTIALLCVTFHSAKNRGARIHCYKCGDSEPQELVPAHDKDVRQCRNNMPTTVRTGTVSRELPRWFYIFIRHSRMVPAVIFLNIIEMFT